MADQSAEQRRKRETDAFARGVRETALALLDTVDDCDRALEALAGAPEAVKDGLANARDRMIAQFERIGFECVYPVDAAFDPLLHEAIGVVSGAGREGVVAEVHRRGWTHKGLLVRAAMVSVFGLGAEPAEEKPPRASADSPSARRRRQRASAGLDNFGFGQRALPDDRSTDG